MWSSEPFNPIPSQAAAPETPATWDPVQNQWAVITNSGRTVTFSEPTGEHYVDVFSTITTSTKKIYFEILQGQVTSFSYIGVINSNAIPGVDGIPGVTAPSYGGYIRSSDGRFMCYSDPAYPATLITGGWVAGNVISMAFDPVAKLIWYRNNNGDNLWNADAGGNPATGAVGHAVPFDGPYYLSVSMDANVGDNTTANFAATDWAYSAPAGFGQLAS